jgi:ribose-phosphate pyrophosphokinase
MVVREKGPPLLFALGGGQAFGEQVARALGTRLAEHEEREFDGGEHKARPLEEVAGRDVYVVQGLAGDRETSANDRLVRLLFFIGALRDARAARVTAVAPYLAYSRKDRRTKYRDPVATRYTAALFEAVGTDCILTMEVHNLAAFENAFRACRPEHLPAVGLLARHFVTELTDEPLAVISPDAGGNKRADLFLAELERHLGRKVAKGLADKHRSAGVMSGSLFAGEVEGRTAIVIDDLCSSGGTLVRAARAARKAGARRVYAAVAHGMFTGGAPELFGPDSPDGIVATDTVPLPADLPQEHRRRIRTISAAPLVAEAIERLNGNRTLEEIVPYD